MDFSEKEKELVLSILEKVEAQRRAGNETLPLVHFNELFSWLDQTEVVFCKKVLQINPYNYGFRGPYVGSSFSPRVEDMAAIYGQEYKLANGAKKQIPVRYLPRSVWLALYDLNVAMRQKLGKEVLVFSGYRSPAYQLCVIFNQLKRKEWDLSRVLSVATMPCYSEHGDPVYTAIDFIPEEGVPSEDALNEYFASTPEFTWLSENAGQHGFYLSYPRDNPWGIVYEPYHWRRFNGMARQEEV